MASFITGVGLLLMGAELLHNKFKFKYTCNRGFKWNRYAVAKAYDERGANVFGVDINKIKNSKKLFNRFSFLNVKFKIIIK